MPFIIASSGNRWSPNGSWCGWPCFTAWATSPRTRSGRSCPRQGVLTGDKDGRLMATTEDVHRQERFITGFAKAGRGTVEAVGVGRRAGARHP